ncbi:MAG: Ni/Fe-hydrogenase cytochrome b subunit [Gemmatimonadota bacterium]|nr:Ni/Fe-hydrogenase cytochrome b subunit [Gemmatimonadota bacterium]
MSRPPTQGLRLTPGLAILLVLAVAGLGLIAYRFAFGLGAVTNLSDGYPWGFWIGMDILVGIALAGGGFVLAGLVHIFGGHRFHALTRPAILTAFLGYLLFIFALMVDLGRPWNIWWALISWNHVSPMFEVAWCVMFYTFVLFLELLPAVLERLQWERAHQLWRRVAPLLVIAALTVFTFAMTDSLGWTVAVAAILAAWETLMRTGVMARDRQMPILLIMAGIMLSTLHQSSLGTLFLITDKLGPLWYTPMLPLLFFLSAVMVAPAMVIFEGLVSARVLHRRPELPLLVPLGRALPFLLAGYLIVRVGDLLFRGVVLETMRQTLATWWWWLEIALVLVALAIFASPDLVRRGRGLLLGATATVLALITHRTGVAIVGLDVPEYGRYVPAWPEVVITAGIVALGLLAFRLAVAFLPIYEPELEPGTAGRAPRAVHDHLTATPVRVG